jgi:sulfonate transport system permease protein
VISKIQNFFVKTWVIILLIALWQIMVSLKIWSPALIASPINTLIDFKSLIVSGELLRHILASLSRIISGLCYGAIVGIIFGLLVGTFPFLKKQLETALSILYSISPLAWIPFLIIALGVGENTKIALVFIVFFMVSSFHTWEGVLQTNQNHLNLGHLLEKNHLNKIIHIWFPSSLSNILAGFRFATYSAWGALLTSEIIASSSGLGYLLWTSRQFSRADDMMVAVVTIGILGFFSDWMIIQVQQKLLHWQEKII